MTELEVSLKRFQSRVDALRAELGKRIVGQRALIDSVLIALLSSGHVLLEGVPGLGKTMLVRSLASALELSFSRIQFTPDLMPADILGTTVIRELGTGQKAFEFEPGPVFANLVLADEINRATPRTQSALLEAMQEHSVTIGKSTRTLAEPFFVLATQNPIEMEGTYPLPEAQLDRFLFKLHVPFPSHSELHEILERTTGRSTPEITRALGVSDILEMRALVREVPVAEHVRDHVVTMLESTHPGQAKAPALVRRYVRFGASPRGAQACLLAAKAHALMAGRTHVAVSDIRDVARPALRHRLILNFEGDADGIDTDKILDEVLAQLPS
ncbi:MAG TPA: MoxR family ATPase [Polyangiales bacterium]|jgi:MoxR-like ATPase|nr:MoxR family ATPase [Polyangiales bacterium]